MEPNPSHIADGNENGFTVPQDVTQLRSDLSLISQDTPRKVKTTLPLNLFIRYYRYQPKHEMSHKHLLTSHYGQNMAHLVSVLQKQYEELSYNLNYWTLLNGIILKYHVYIVECSMATKKWCVEPCGCCSAVWCHIQETKPDTEDLTLHKFMDFQYPELANRQRLICQRPVGLTGENNFQWIVSFEAIKCLKLPRWFHNSINVTGLYTLSGQ